MNARMQVDYWKNNATGILKTHAEIAKCVYVCTYVCMNVFVHVEQHAQHRRVSAQPPLRRMAAVRAGLLPEVDRLSAQDGHQRRGRRHSHQGHAEGGGEFQALPVVRSTLMNSAVQFS